MKKKSVTHEEGYHMKISSFLGFPFNIVRLNSWLPLNALSTNQHEKTEIQNPTSVQQRVKTTPVSMSKQELYRNQCTEAQQWMTLRSVLRIYSTSPVQGLRQQLSGFHRAAPQWARKKQPRLGRCWAPSAGFTAASHQAWEINITKCKQNPGKKKHLNYKQEWKKRDENVFQKLKEINICKTF